MSDDDRGNDNWRKITVDEIKKIRKHFEEAGRDRNCKEIVARVLRAVEDRRDDDLPAPVYNIGDVVFQKRPGGGETLGKVSSRNYVNHWKYGVTPIEPNQKTDNPLAVNKTSGESGSRSHSCDLRRPEPGLERLRAYLLALKIERDRAELRFDRLDSECARMVKAWQVADGVRSKLDGFTTE